MSIERELLQESQLIVLNFYKLVSFCHYAGIVLGTEEKKFAIYGHASMEAAFRFSDSDQDVAVKSRPLTHNLVNFVLSGFTIRVVRVVVYAYKDHVFYTRLFLEQQQGDFLYVTDIDARPSDSIPLALMHKVPILCVKSVFDSVIPYQE